jgi:hypothetical protein
MALVRNGANLYASSNHWVTVLGIGSMRNNFDSTGQHRNWPAGEHRISNVTIKSGFPNGYRGGAAWLLPQKGGAVVSRNECYATLTGAGVGAKGRPGSGAATITITGTALGGLIAGGVASATVTISADGAIVATLGAVGAAAIEISGTLTRGALGWLVSDAVVTIDGGLVSYGIGHMDGTTAEAGLTPSGIATAVWSRIVEAGFSAEEILRLLAAHAAGDADGLDGGTTEFMALDGSKARITGSVAGGMRLIDARDGS